VSVIRLRDGSLIVPARVTTSDGSAGEGIKRIDRQHPLYDAWRSYCERHPEDVVERRGRLGETGEDLAEGLAAACAGVLFIGFFAAIDLAKGVAGIDLTTAVIVGGVLWVCFFIAGVVSSRRSRDRAAGRLRLHAEVEVEPPPAGWRVDV
jgi:hypothetical protein